MNQERTQAGTQDKGHSLSKNLILKVTYHDFCSIPLVTKTPTQDKMGQGYIKACQAGVRTMGGYFADRLPHHTKPLTSIPEVLVLEDDQVSGLQESLHRVVVVLP